MDTEAVAFFARSPTEHVTFWPVTEQLLDTAPIATLDGSVSTIFTSLAVPSPTFWAVIVKVTEPRAFTVAVLADLLTFTSGSGPETLTVTVLLELLFCLLEGSFEALTVPALSTFGQEPLEVCTVKVTDSLAPAVPAAVRVPRSHVIVEVPEQLPGFDVTVRLAGITSVILTSVASALPMFSASSV